jgi:hypothetical protein
MPISNYPHGFTNGVTIRNIPLITTQPANGNTFWVDSVRGSNGNKGTFTQPLASIDYAVGLCTANQGDTIIVAAGHTETVITASGLTLDVAGITIICMGNGSNGATISIGGVVGASMVVSAANVTLVNPRFVAALDALTGPISITGANFTLLNGKWYDAPAKAATNCIVATTAATELKIDGWKYFASTTGTQKVSNITLTAVASPVLSNISISGDFSTGNINNATTACTDVRLENVFVKNSNATPKPGIVIQAGNSGIAKSVDVRIASGTTFVSNVSGLNWDNNCLGYAADGTKGVLIGS